MGFQPKNLQFQTEKDYLMKIIRPYIQIRLGIDYRWLGGVDEAS